MITTKQRAYLRGLANDMPALYQMGKGGLSDEFIAQINEALEANELIKINVLKNTFYSPKDAMADLCEAVGCDPVSVVGNKLVVYRQASDKNKRKIELIK